MELKKFRNRYDLELIPASHEGIILGTLVWDPLIGKPVFDHRGMPDHVFNAFLDAEIITEEEWEQAIQSARVEELKAANLAVSTVDIDIDLISTLEQPMIGELSHKFSLKSLKKFSFGDLKVRLMSPLLRIQIDNYLDQLKTHDWKYYDIKIRRVFMITELYYGRIKIVIDKSSKSDFAAAIKRSDLKIENESVLGSSIEYSFKHKEVPFAMKLEWVRGFTG